MPATQSASRCTGASRDCASDTSLQAGAGGRAGGWAGRTADESVHCLRLGVQKCSASSWFTSTFTGRLKECSPLARLGLGGGQAAWVQP